MKLKIVCPFCCATFYRTGLKYRCTSNACEDRRKSNASKNNTSFKAEFSLRVWKMFSPQCPYCSNNVRTVCPKCKETLPEKYVKGDGMVISIIGAKNSGKTTYMTVLYRELVKIWPAIDDVNQFDIRILKNEKKINDFIKQLYDIKDRILNTGKNDNFAFQIEAGKKKVTLLFTDPPGEWFMEAENQNMSYLSHSDAYILLFDATEFNNKDNTNRENSANNVMNSFLRWIKVKKSKRKPLAIVFNKYDQATWFTKDKISTIDQEGANIHVMEQRSGQIQQFIKENHSAANFFNMLFRNYMGSVTFFEVSTLGSDHTSKEFKDKGPQPYRVMDPFLWILAQKKFPIKTKKSKI